MNKYQVRLRRISGNDVAHVRALRLIGSRHRSLVTRDTDGVRADGKCEIQVDRLGSVPFARTNYLTKERSLRKCGIMVLLVGILVAPLAQADGATEQEALKNLGIALGWRLAPATIEEHCRGIDPAGARIRADAMRDWQTNNAKLIQAVDDRVKEIVPLFKSAPANMDVAKALRAQIKDLILETNFADDDPEKTLAACKVEADPARTTWTSNGRPFVDEALTALHDWKIQQTAK